MNNLKQIREIYGATQEEIAFAINVNRVTVANWESSTSKMSSSNQEKLSIYYGIGPEYFYNKPLSDEVKLMLLRASTKEKELEGASGGTFKKSQEFSDMFADISFHEVLRNYMFSMKMMLAKADNGELDKLKVASLINKKMGERLEAIINLREAEIQSGTTTLYELMDELENDRKGE